MAELFTLPARATDSNNATLSGAKLYFYATGTTTPQAVYSSGAMDTPLSNPVEADSGGKFPAIYLDPALTYRGVCKSADGSQTIYDIDPVGSGFYGAFAGDGGSALVRFLQAGIGAVSRTAQSKLRDTVSVKDFGAVGDGVADDTAAIRATIDAVGNAGGGAVLFPPGSYKVTGTITITKQGVALEGVGDGSLIVPTGDFGDVFHAYPATGPNLQGFRIKDLFVYAANDTTRGAILHLDRCNGFRVDHCRFNAHYGGIHVDGSVHGYIDADIQSDANFAAFRSGSYLFKATRGSDNTIPAEIHVAGSDWRGQNGNYRLHYAVLIQCADGIWFDQPHFGFAKVGLALNPASNTDPIISIVVRGGYLDTCEENLFQSLRPSATYSADYGLHSLEFASQYNSGGDGWNWYCKTTGNQLWSEVALGNMLQLGGHGVNFSLCDKINLKPGFAIMAPSNGGAGFYGIVLNADATNINIGSGVISKHTSPNTPAGGVLVASAVDKFTIGQLRVIGCTNTIADNSTTSNKSITSALSW